MAQLDIHVLQTATAWDRDGEKLGAVSQVHLDKVSGEAVWITVPLGLFNTREHFVPVAGARLDGENVYVAAAKDMIADSPDLSADSELTPAQEDLLREHYGH